MPKKISKKKSKLFRKTDKINSCKKNLSLSNTSTTIERLQNILKDKQEFCKDRALIGASRIASLKKI